VPDEESPYLSPPEAPSTTETPAFEGSAA
jgi:hypothetical protein